MWILWYYPLYIGWCLRTYPDENNVTNGWFTFNTDIRGSVTDILDSNGFTVTGYVYDEFGNRTETGEEDFLNEATYTGAVYDEEIGLYYMNARYYDCTTGQFISRDTYLGNAYNPWTQNLYTYTGNNPINYTDPQGIKICTEVGRAMNGIFTSDKEKSLTYARPCVEMR